MRDLRRGNRQAYGKCRNAIRQLEEFGHELRRPAADFLRDGIYELRIRAGRVNYRILYFFHGRGVALLAHALTKEGKIPSQDIDRAIMRLKRFMEDPGTHQAELDDE